VAKGQRTYQKFWMLFVLGLLLILVGFLILMIATMLSSEASASFGGFIMIGPFPIVFGAGPEAAWMVLFAIVMAVLSIVIFFVLHREIRR